VEFIPIAEKTGLIRLLTARVLRASLQAAARWAEAGQPVPVSVNLSPRILRDPGFTTTVADLLRLTGIDPSMLCFEVTESTVMHDAPTSRTALEQLDELGVSLSIDDFGTGYSSLAAIRDLPLQELKVDRSFVIGMENDPGAAAIVGSTVALAHRLGMRVIAEGVETEQALELLAEMGCDVAQGFHLGRPMPESQLLKWLDDWHRRGGSAAVVPIRSDGGARRRRSGA
jgi:EAL domain-containing protein (putative c-di-GMP-specific phosphodiesterase class I)